MRNHNGIFEYSFKLKSDLSELKDLRLHLQHCAQAIGLSENCLFEINVCLDELFTNVVTYGFKKDAEHLITFAFKAAGHELTIEIEDKSVPFNPLEIEDPKMPADPIDFKIGGLGIYIVKNLTDNVWYKRKHGKNKLTLKKYIQANS